jgi:hypothetical protein
MKRTAPLIVVLTTIVVGVFSVSLASAAWTQNANTPGGKGSATSIGTPGAGSVTSKTDTSMTISWSAPNGIAPTSYEISRGGSVIATCAPSPATATTCTDTGLSASTSYSYTVKAKRNGWTGPANAAFGGTTNAPAFTVTSTHPSGLAQGQSNRSVVLVGTGFTNSPTSTVTFSGTAVTGTQFSFISSTQVSFNVTVSGTATLGARNVTLTQPGGSTTCTGCFTVGAPPTITSTSPTTALPHDNAVTTITVNGTGFVTGFTATTSGSNYTVTATSFISSTQVTVDIKNANTNNGTDTKNLTITNPDFGSATATGALKN